MKFFTKKSITQKITIVVIISILFSFTFPTYSQADVFGVLFDPIFEFVSGIGDSILAILQKYLYNGHYNIKGGLGNILMGKYYFKTVIKNNYKDFEEMRFSDPGGIAIKIEEDDFDEISLASMALAIISPVAGIVAIAADAITGNNYMIPTLQYSVDKIFAGKIPAFNINFINPNSSGNSSNSGQNNIRITEELSKTISKWYKALRDIAVVGLLSVLLYTGIRILISSSADDKAKYKQRIFDWLVAMCLLFFMHYIMAIIVSLIDIINATIANSATSIPVEISGTDIRFNTDLMGLVRLQMQYKDIGEKTTYFIMYIALLVYTCKYTWVYMKRTITMAFLTMIAPLVAMTYPIDKMNDGKAQAFSAWLKEYIFTALLQPFHLIIYSALVGSAMSLAAHNPLYSILVIAFMGPAEKLLRKFFGFDKASTPNTLSSAGAMFGGAAAFNMFKKGIGLVAGKNSSKGGSNDNVRTRNNPVEDQNAPDGYRAFANNNNGGTEIGDDENIRRQLQQQAQSNTQDIDEEGLMANMYLGNDEEYVPNNRQLTQNQSEFNEEGLMSNMYLGNDEEYVASNNVNTPKNANARIRMTENLVQPRNSEENEKEKSKRDKLQRLLLSSAGVGAYKGVKNWTAKNFGDTERAKNTLKRTGASLLRSAGKAAIIGSTAAVGVGMGIAGDDLEDVLKYGAGGAALGASIAPGVEKRISNSKLVQATNKEHGIRKYGNQNTAEVKAQTAELYQTGELRDWAQRTFLDKEGNERSGKELNELEDRAIEHYNNGFTDKGDIKRVMKLEDKLKSGINANLPEEEKIDRSKEMAETVGKLAQGIKPDKLSDKKYIEGKIEEFQRGIKKTNPELNDREVANNANMIMDLIMQYYKKP